MTDFKYTYTDKDEDTLTITASHDKTYVVVEGQSHADTTYIHVRDADVPLVAQKLLQAAGQEGWFVPKVEQCSTEFHVYADDGEVYDEDDGIYLTAVDARVKAAALLAAADGADADKAKAEEPRDQAIKALDKLFASNQSCKERASSVVGYLEAEGYTIVKREDS